jgi:trans-aconitate methyltransferase
MAAPPTDRIASLKGTLARTTAEGAAYLAGALRESIRRDVPRDARTLEIGAGARPMFRRAEFPNAKILDYYTTEELVRHFQEDYQGQKVTAAQFEPVDYVCKDGDYRKVIGDDARFDVIFSAHALEHQPDLVRHLQTLQGLLADDGMIVFVVPDKRCTFDVFRQVTTTSDVLAAYAERRRAPGPKAFFDVYAASTAENLGRRVTARHKLSFCYDLREALAHADEARARDAAGAEGEPA